MAYERFDTLLQASKPLKKQGFASAVVFSGDRTAALRDIGLKPLGAEEARIAVRWSGVSTGTERLFWTGEMPPFPGLGYPLVPGYEAVGEIVEAPSAPERVGERVFAPGSSGFE
ncbi:MAG: hypothetical protein AAFQ67_07255, partial [Pseudomonadota bacterium]